MNIAIDTFTTYFTLRAVSPHLSLFVIGKEAFMKSSKLCILRVIIINNFVMFLKRYRDTYAVNRNILKLISIIKYVSNYRLSALTFSLCFRKFLIIKQKLHILQKLVLKLKVGLNSSKCIGPLKVLSTSPITLYHLNISLKPVLTR